MNSKITRALSDSPSGDIMTYFNEVDHIIQLNDGIHDCKMLSMECYDRPTPVKYNQYTKFHLSDAGLDCINIDKSYITATMTYHMKLNQITEHTLTTDWPQQFQFYKLFIGLKNASHNFDTYRILSIIILFILKQIQFMNKFLLHLLNQKLKCIDIICIQCGTKLIIIQKMFVVHM